MDMKALEWMSQRVDQAQKILKRKKALDDFVRRIEMGDPLYVTIADRNITDAHIGYEEIGKEPIKAMAQAAADIARAEIARLQKEFEEL